MYQMQDSGKKDKSLTFNWGQEEAPWKRGETLDKFDGCEDRAEESFHWFDPPRCLMETMDEEEAGALEDQR
jgi:hypothetical protein